MKSLLMCIVHCYLALSLACAVENGAEAVNEKAEDLRFESEILEVMDDVVPQLKARYINYKIGEAKIMDSGDIHVKLVIDGHGDNRLKEFKSELEEFLKDHGFIQENGELSESALDIREEIEMEISRPKSSDESWKVRKAVRISSMPGAPVSYVVSEYRSVAYMPLLIRQAIRLAESDSTTNSEK